MKSLWTLYVDGAARGNPGPAGAGVVLCDPEGNVADSYSKYLGERTNNVAEYSALILGLEKSADKGISNILILADSELLVKQMTGVYRVKDPNLRILFKKAVELLQKFGKYEFRHIPRDKNKEADKMANHAIDAA